MVSFKLGSLACATTVAVELGLLPELMPAPGGGRDKGALLSQAQQCARDRPSAAGRNWARMRVACAAINSPALRGIGQATQQARLDVCPMGPPLAQGRPQRCRLGDAGAVGEVRAVWRLSAETREHSKANGSGKRRREGGRWGSCSMAACVGSMIYKSGKQNTAPCSALLRGYTFFDPHGPEPTRRIDR